MKVLRQAHELSRKQQVGGRRMEVEINGKSNLSGGVNAVRFRLFEAGAKLSFQLSHFIQKSVEERTYDRHIPHRLYFVHLYA